jgi:hypothetical protein
VSFKTGLSNEFYGILQLSERFFGGADKTMAGQPQLSYDPFLASSLPFIIVHHPTSLQTASIVK